MVDGKWIEGIRRGEFSLLQQLYNLLAQIGLHYRACPMNSDILRAWLRLGYPVIVAGAESSFHDLALGDGVPYPWHPSVLTIVQQNRVETHWKTCVSTKW